MHATLHATLPSHTRTERSRTRVSWLAALFGLGLGLAALTPSASAQPRRVEATDEAAPAEEAAPSDAAPSGDEDEGGRAAPRTAHAEAPAAEPVRV